MKKAKKRIVRKSAFGPDHPRVLSVAGVTFRMPPAAQVRKASGGSLAALETSENSTAKQIRSLYHKVGYDPIGSTREGVVIVRPSGKSSINLKRLEKAISAIRAKST
jgi:hypothetical protein